MKVVWWFLFVSVFVEAGLELAMSASLIPEHHKEHWWLAGVYLLFVAPTFYRYATE